MQTRGSCCTSESNNLVPLVCCVAKSPALYSGGYLGSSGGVWLDRFICLVFNRVTGRPLVTCAQESLRNDVCSFCGCRLLSAVRLEP